MNTSTPPSFIFPQDLGFRLTRFVLTGLFLLMLIAALHPEMRSFVRASLSPESRLVISTLKGDLRGNGTTLTIVKVKTQVGLAIEIYEVENFFSKMVSRIELPNVRDGYFDFNRQTVNLAVDDVDGDGTPEILVPGFDANMMGSLIALHFDKETETLKRVALN